MWLVCAGGRKPAPLPAAPHPQTVDGIALGQRFEDRPAAPRRSPCRMTECALSTPRGVDRHRRPPAIPHESTVTRGLSSGHTAARP